MGVYNKKLVGIILFTDASKAYPKAWHSGMIRKLYEKYEIRGSLLLWIDDWLRDRTARFKFGNTVSEHMSLESGVPEGSSLSCFLFITYYDIYECIKNTDFQIYCDDVTPYKLFSPDRWGEMQNDIQKDLNRMTEWCLKWRMRFNGDKSGYLIIDRRNKPHQSQTSWNINLNLQGKIKRVDSGRCLGLIFDERLTFEKHALATHLKLQKKRRFLLRLCCSRSFMPLNVRLKFYKSWLIATSCYVAPIWRSRKNQRIQQIDSLESQTLKRILGLPGSIPNDVPHVLTGTLPPRYRTKVQCTKSWLRTNAWIDDGNGHEVCEEIHNWSSYGFHIEELQKRWNRVSLFRRLSSISNDLLDDEPPTILTTRAALKKDLKKHHKMIKSSAFSAFEEEWSNDLTRAIQLKNLGFLPSSQITGIRLKLPSIAITWMRAICGVGNLGKFMLSRGQCEEADATCNICGVVKDMDHLLQCEKYEHQQLRFRNQLNAIMNRNDETKLLTESEKEARTAARTARHRRPDIDAFKCMKHIIEETNRYNISAVAAALHSYIRMTIEKI